MNMYEFHGHTMYAVGEIAMLTERRRRKKKKLKQYKTLPRSAGRVIQNVHCEDKVLSITKSSLYLLIF